MSKQRNGYVINARTVKKKLRNVTVSMFPYYTVTYQ